MNENCKRLGTGQCAAICLQHSSNFTTNGECPEADLVWKDKELTPTGRIVCKSPIMQTIKRGDLMHQAIRKAFK